MRPLFFVGVGLTALAASVTTTTVMLVSATSSLSAFEVGTVIAVGSLAWILLTYPFGALADRGGTRSVLVLAAASAVAGGAIQLLPTSGATVGLLAAAAFFCGVSVVGVEIGAQSAIARVESAEARARNNSTLVAVSTGAGGLIGPLTGASLVGTAPNAAYLLSCGLAGAGGVILAILRPPTRRTHAEAKWMSRPDSARPERIRLSRPLVLLLGLTSVNVLASQMALTVIALFLVRNLSVSSATYGVVVAVAAVGSVAGALAVHPVSKRMKRTSVLLGLLLANSVAFALLAVSQDAWQVVILGALNGFCTSGWTVLSLGIRQELIPPEHFGRQNAKFRLALWTVVPVGNLLGGIVAGWDIRGVFIIAAALRLVALPLLALPLTSALTHSVQADSHREQE